MTVTNVQNAQNVSVSLQLDVSYVQNSRSGRKYASSVWMMIMTMMATMMMIMIIMTMMKIMIKKILMMMTKR